MTVSSKPSHIIDVGHLFGEDVVETGPCSQRGCTLLDEWRFTEAQGSVRA